MADPTDKPESDDPLEEADFESPDEAEEAPADQPEAQAEEASGEQAEEAAAEDAGEAAAEDAGKAAEETPEKPAPERPRRPRGPRKPWMDVYTAMLGLTLLATIVASLFLALELSRYDFQTKPDASSATSD